MIYLWHRGRLRSKTTHLKYTTIKLIIIFLHCIRFIFIEAALHLQRACFRFFQRVCCLIRETIIHRHLVCCKLEIPICDQVNWLLSHKSLIASNAFLYVWHIIRVCNWLNTHTQSLLAWEMLQHNANRTSANEANKKSSVTYNYVEWIVSWWAVDFIQYLTVIVGIILYSLYRQWERWKRTIVRMPNKSNKTQLTSVNKEKSIPDKWFLCDTPLNSSVVHPISYDAYAVFVHDYLYLLSLSWRGPEIKQICLVHFAMIKSNMLCLIVDELKLLMSHRI